MLVPGLVIVNSAGVASVTPGSVVHYTVTITDTGQTPYTGISVTDSLSGLLDDAVYNGDAAATAGSVSLCQPGADVGGEPGGGGGGDGEVLGDGEYR